MVFSLAACGTPADNDSPAPNTESLVIDTETPVADTPTYELVTIRVAYMSNLGSTGPLPMGIGQDYFEETGLTIETSEFQGGSTEITAITSDNIDISQIDHDAHKLCIQGEAKIFQMDHTTPLSDMTVGNKAKDIEITEDLKGKTVAMPSGTSSEVILEQTLACVGTTIDDINTVKMITDGTTTAMTSGQTDAATSWSPDTVALRNALGDNYMDLSTSADFLDSAIFPSSYIYTPEHVEANHDILVRFIQALDRTRDWRTARPEEMAKLLARKLDASEDTILVAIGEADWRVAAEVYGGTDTVKTIYEVQQGILLDSGAITENVPVEDCVLLDVMQGAYNACSATR